MECKICERERPVRKAFKTDWKRGICDECLDDMGYGRRVVGEVFEEVKTDLASKLDRKIERAVQSELPRFIEKLMVESGIEFELVVR